ncbi:MAG: 2-deoxy-5-keto-D-gluconate 6-phosphate aldolase domain-containing protein [Rhodomicrobium sp.]
MTRGFDKQLYILPFDHRGSFQTKMFGWKGTLDARQTAEIASAKRVVYDGFCKAMADGVPRDKAAILTDEQFGAAILRDAKAEGYMTACPAEKSGREEFEFEYGDDFAKHIEAFDPTFCKVLVRYNPEGDAALIRRQSGRLRRLSEYLRSKGRSLFMFELLVPPEEEELAELHGDKQAYDRELRPRLMVDAIQQLQDEGVEPDIWKIEGLDRREDCERVVAAARRNGRGHVSCIVLGRGEDEKKVHEWLTVAGGVPGFIGFAVGRTVFWDPLVNLRAGKISREAAVGEIANRYATFAGTFEKARTAGKAHFS